MEKLLLTKIGALIVIFSLALLSGLLPIKLRNFLLNNSKIPEKYTLITLSASLCCGAGVLMATVFLHILRETREGFEQAMAQGAMATTHYSLAEILMCTGFFLIYLLEEIVHLCFHKKPKDDEEQEDFYKFNRVSSINLRTSQKIGQCDSITMKSRNVLTCREGLGDPVHADLHDTMNLESEVACNNNSNIDDINARDIVLKKPAQSAPIMSKVENNSGKESLVRSFLVILALSLHGAFEGLSLGLEDSTNNVWLLCMALSSHKVFIAFSIGMEMLEEGVTMSIYLIQMGVFSLASPLGGTLGLTLTASLQNNDDVGILIITILKGVSGGTILYVTFCEVLERERTKASGRFIRLFALIIGFSIMAGLEVATLEQEHELGNESSLNITGIGNHAH